ncbi:hypothetical protein HJG54_27260 [Leptolyngbya sp. NK1-12]|uniref:Uncharacterized protein n=1 Tax=Leptolyngbya sp. NK1-12 TaxID=2547451 RepID=A0AA96WJ82_9CYAN|nr:hypothetical protein [Leptolyngbya sp. NK1-12]WNZ26155.1 hypothetical protein HJG54_27260 [Leptolyngbya sp. NK1-12]
MVDPLLILVGAAGIALIFYAFSRVNLLSRNARLIGISALMVVLILLGNRFLSPERRPILPDNIFRREAPPQPPTPRETLPYDNLPDPSPDATSPQPQPTPVPPLQSGWNEELERLMPVLILDALARSSSPESGSPSSPIPSPSPLPASPIPASPSPILPPVSPVPPSPSPPRPPTVPSPSPSIPPAEDYENPDFDRPEQIPPRPAPVPPTRRPSPARPVPGWW